MDTSELEAKLVSRVNPEILVEFYEQYLKQHGGRVDLLELMTNMNIWLEDTLRISRFLFDNGHIEADGHDVVQKTVPDPAKENYLRDYQWLVKWDLTYRPTYEFTGEELSLLDRFRNLAVGKASQ